ncbi:MAG TPA: D-alanyl-D-alanine endopeptidase [Povalibacter sp.]|uniref:D-alanyl-D-alanine endopeptidase n=1 Tax=Povalibacter sp. TaxID=1962978 RepID=UPI002B71BAD1|nr:D-alanyl-D-alanine endopeptidase [Povalibacter sp.]HMN46128.1 D-alanyl-D-alanine endopeptidase [Povalibacter sp.]
MMRSTVGVSALWAATLVFAAITSNATTTTQPTAKPKTAATATTTKPATAPGKTTAASTAAAKPKTATAQKPKTVVAKPLGLVKTGDGRSAPEIRSSSVLVIDESDSSILLSRNADVAAPIASITKLMTALVVLDAALPLEEVITITNADRAIDRGAPSRLHVGAELTRGELMHLALMSSENHAAHALGRTYPGGTDAILEAMNAKAKALGMKRTHFTDTTGLSSGNIASPEDLSRLVIFASQNPLIEKYSTDPDETVMVGRYPVEYRNTNGLVRKPEWDIRLQKTGYTQAAGRCLVMKTFIGDRPIVMVLMNSFGKYTRTADAIRVRRWMESALSQATLASSGG